VLAADLYAHIQAQTGITNLIGTRFYPVVLPQSVKDKPCAVYRRLPRSEQRYELITKSSGVVNAYYGITAYATTYEAVQNVAEAFRNELEGYGPGTWNGTRSVINVKQIDESDDFAPATDTGLVNDLFAVLMVYEIMYTESEPTL
jgi:hypothetical protein